MCVCVLLVLLVLQLLWLFASLLFAFDVLSELIRVGHTGQRSHHLRAQHHHTASHGIVSYPTYLPSLPANTCLRAYLPYLSAAVSSLVQPPSLRQTIVCF
ncbi:hypothetical protein F4780DRAFT_732732 [Xylariomycetidae sp. FL0641]|nr:hypothetical protein F4780DRAFT_732732 [Xylariomycetidae sp. FL0641]